MRPEDTLETNCSIQVDVSCWDRTGVPHRLIHSNPISLYLVSTFVFFIIIITLSCQYHPCCQKRNTTVIFFVQSRFNKQCKNTFCFPLNLLSWTANFNFSVHILVLKKVTIVAVVLLLIVINDVDRDLVCP